jgi:catechol 2,3-dioxygenase-like lactoylglutathione lyase family enzyme
MLRGRPMKTEHSPEGVFRTLPQPAIVVQKVSACLSVANLDETASWYERALGFRTVRSMHFAAQNPEYSARVAFLQADGGRLELLEDQLFIAVRRPNPPRHAAMQGVSQLALYVEDLDAAVEQLQSRDIPLVMGPVTVEELGIRACFIRDNEGNLIELLQDLTIPTA